MIITIGSEGRWDYSAIGSVMNLAARLCAEAKPGQILAPKRFLGTIEDIVEAEGVGEFALKGFHRGVTAYNILGLKSGWIAPHGGADAVGSGRGGALGPEGDCYMVPSLPRSV